ncbi:hypothetical protein SAMN02745202_02158 [Segatella oulorum]|uniref:Uncharacterized protein n=1 Tax=Segatella oulorum TaxID=28136 RepID=A0A1T4RAD8_9BACT|nr:hypothetical protein SAMN02745202_02158 [Segatella oulorum]
MQRSHIRGSFDTWHNFPKILHLPFIVVDRNMKYSIGKNVFLPHCKNRIDLIAEDCSKELSFTYFEQVISCQTTNNGSCEDSDLSLNIAYRFVEGE